MTPTTKIRVLTPREREIIDRIRARAEEVGMSMSDLAVAVGRSEPLGRQWNTYRAFPPQRILQGIAERLDVRMNWLLSGENEPADRALTVVERETLATMRELPLDLQKLLLATAKGWRAEPTRKK